SENELGAVTRLVSRAEDLELNRIFEDIAEKRSDVVRPMDRSLFKLGLDFETVAGWSLIKQPPKMSLEDNLREMIELHKNTTVMIHIDQMYFNCHLVVLQAYSRFFLDLEGTPMLVTLPSHIVSQKAFLLIYKWMLSDEPHLERPHLLDVYLAATYLKIDDLITHCWTYFDNKDCFSEESAAILYVETMHNPAMDLVRNIMIRRIHKFLLTFVATSEFLELPSPHVYHLLNDSNICVNTEVEVLFSIVRWLTHDWENRLWCADMLMSCVRFNLMPLWFLLYIRRDEANAQIKELIAIDEIDIKINQSIAAITTRMYEGNLAGMGEISGLILTRKGQEQRCWIRDRLCTYFHYIGCPNTREIRYAGFEQYLEDLQEASCDHWAKVEYHDPSTIINCCNRKKPYAPPPVIQ
ncbi:hypothetical protein KR018_010747, partial [Drosophila ironensis]